jgi:murein DD-endopeptidase MepM/ murein hydrolase activator NlpD
MRAVDSYSSDDMKEFINNMKSLEGDDLALAVKDQFVTLQTEFGLTAEQASDSIRAMYEVMGRGSADAEAAIASLMDQVGQMDSSKMADALKFQADVFFSKEAGTEEAKDAAKDIAKTFTRAMADANQSEAAAMFSALKDTVSKGWTNAFNGVLTEGTNELNERLREFGINSGSELAAGLEKYGGSQGLVEAIWGSDADPMVIAQFRDELDALTGSASAAEKAIIKALAADIPGLDDNIDSMREFEGSLDALAYTAKSWDGGELTNMMNMLANPPQGRYFDEIVTNGTELQKTFALANDEQRLAYANTILLGRGLKQADTMAEAVKIAALGIRTNLNSAAGAARNLANSIAFSKSQVADMMKSSMGAVQSMIADDYRDAKEEQWDKQMESTQNYWDNYVSNVNADIDRQKKGLENKWEKRKDGADKYWDNRIKAIEKTIDAEEKAEEKRQKMFDAEIARIQRLTDMANTNIDFNIALNEGNLDEAAKIANDIEARSMQWAYEDAAAKSADKSEKRQDKLSAEKDRLEESRDAAMDAMAKREEQEKAHLDKISDMRQKAAEADRDAAIEAKQQEIDNQKKMLDEALRIFTSGTAAEQKEMKKRMEQAGLSYDWFENNVIKPKGTTWGKYFGDELHRQLKLSADQIKNDSMWSMIGDSGISAMAKSMGFAGKNDLMHFLKTGEIKGLKDGEAGGSSTNDGKRLPGKKEDEMGTYHTGGEIGGDKGGRKGVARTLGGLHNSEMMVRAQKGEYMINRDAAKKYGDILPEINSQTYQRGHFGLDRTKMPKNGVGGEPGQGPAPFFAAAILRGIQKNIMNNLKPIVKSQKKQQQSQGLDGSLDLSGWGQKSGRFYKAADPGKGWSNTHDYRNGLKSPLYAIGSGTVSAVTYGPGAGSGEHPNAYPRGYGSYGVLATLQTDAGPSVKYAHLWPGSVKTGRVEGGEQIALSASTGNSSGPHTHFEVNGSTNAQGIFAGLGIPLFKGAQYVNYDNTLANLHKGEAVLTKDINSDFHRGVENFANGSPGDTIININGYDYSMEALANMVVSKMEQRELRKPQSRTIKNRTSN